MSSFLDALCQGMLLFFGAGAIYAFASDRYRLGFWLTLLGEPFWLMTSIMNKQWGIIFLSIWYACCAIKGLYGLKNKPQNCFY